MTQTFSTEFDARAFRDALAVFPTGVAVVLTQDEAGGAIGITINSFASVSLDPPLVLWSIGRGASRAAAFRDAAVLTINVLSVDQEAIARRFAADPRLERGDAWLSVARGGAPAIAAANAVFVCEPYQMVEAGDHFVWIGRVVDVAGPGAKPALSYYRSRYGRAD